MPPEPHTTDPGADAAEVDRLRAEVDRLRRINTVLMDRVEQSAETVGSSLGLFHLASELSQQLEHRQQALRETARKADLANRAKTEFLANMSHEIRTPMTAILGYTDLLADPALSEHDRRVHIGTIKRNGEHLLSVINDVLDLSRIETGRMTVEHVPTSPVRIIEEVASLMRARACECGLELSVRYETEMPESIDADPVRLRQIVTNLVGNAVKFTESGRVTIRARFVSDDDARFEIDVEDTGIGMDTAQLERIFDAFTQADASTARRFGGSGLGLKISKSLADLLDWSLTVESTPGVGSTFRLSAPLDSPHALRMTGPEQIAELCEDVLEGRQPPGSDAPCEETARPLRGRTVLLAEDGPDNQRLIAHHLRKAGAETLIVDNGCRAVDHFDEPDLPRADLVLMDMQMPEMDGYDATHELRQRGVDVPIIALTAHAMEGDREKCLDAGCDDYLTKPIDRDSLINCCAEHLERRTGQSSSV